MFSMITYGLMLSYNITVQILQMTLEQLSSKIITKVKISENLWD